MASDFFIRSHKIIEQEGRKIQYNIRMEKYMNLMNCLIGFVKRRAEDYTNAHVFTRYSLVWQDAFLSLHNCDT